MSPSLDLDLWPVVSPSLDLHLWSVVSSVNLHLSSFVSRSLGIVLYVCFVGMHFMYSFQMCILGRHCVNALRVYIVSMYFMIASLVCFAGVHFKCVS